MQGIRLAAFREGPYSRPHWQEDVENIQWLEIFLPFTTVKSLSLSNKFTPRVVPALQELSGESIMEVLPALQSISYQSPRYQDLSRRHLRSFSLQGSCPVTLWP
jgi:hypothetical protein